MFHVPGSSVLRGLTGTVSAHRTLSFILHSQLASSSVYMEAANSAKGMVMYLAGVYVVARLTLRFSKK